MANKQGRWWALAICVAWAAGCVGPGLPSASIPLREPPQELVEASTQQSLLQAGDVLQVKLADGSAVNVTQRLVVLPDGSIELSGQGKVTVAGKTVEQAREALQAQLAVAEAALSPLVELQLCQYGLVIQSAAGEREIRRVPLEGRVTVKSALADIPEVERKVIWIVRSREGGFLAQQMLAVDWDAIVHQGDNTTNYQLKPGDWIIAAHEPAKGFARVAGAVSSMVRQSKEDEQTEAVK